MSKTSCEVGSRAYYDLFHAAYSLSRPGQPGSAGTVYRVEQELGLPEAELALLKRQVARHVAAAIETVDDSRLSAPDLTPEEIING